MYGRSFFNSLWLLTAICMFSFVHCSHNGSRYFPFIQQAAWPRSDRYTDIKCTPFFTEATDIASHDIKKVGIAGVWGLYDLSSVIKAVECCRRQSGQTFEHPFTQTFGLSDFIGKKIAYAQEGRIRSAGLYLAGEQYLGTLPFSVGFSLPFMVVESSNVFELDPSKSDPLLCDLPQATIDELDTVRRSVHDAIGLCVADWHKGGMGDLDLFARWYQKWQRLFWTRSIQTSLSIGVLVPTSTRQDFSIPTSIPFMGNRHWGMYVDAVIEAELKTNWKLGCMFGWSKYFSRYMQSRIPLAWEPLIYAPLCGLVSVDPGNTFKISPYIVLENVLDGVHFHVQYTHLRHRKDRWRDFRPAYQKAHLPSTLVQQEALSRWESSYLTFGIIYDARGAFKKWPLDPTIHVTYDQPLDTWSNGAAKTNQFSVGLHLHF